MINTVIKGVELSLQTSSAVFSPKIVDQGTLAMLSMVEFTGTDRVLDLGCGYGVVGILAAKLIGPQNVVMLDIDPVAIELARRNAASNGVPGIQIIQSEGFTNLKEKDFTLILCNPPYHVDFAVPRLFIEKGFNRLRTGGRMYMVTKRREWYQNKLAAIFGGVKVWEIDNYYVFMSHKKTETYANAKKK